MPRKPKFENPDNSLGMLALESQQGNNEASEKLLAAFRDKLIMKYFRMLRAGHVNCTNKDTRRFMSLFISDAATRHKLKKNWTGKEARFDLYQTAAYICDKLKSVPDEDLEQDLVQAFFICVNKYKPLPHRPHVVFQGYIYNIYKFRVYDVVQRYMKSFNTYHEEKILEFKKEIDPKIPEGPVLVDEKWVCGETCDDLFLDLSTEEREILKLSYIDKLPDTEIGRMYSIHRNTVRIKKRRIKDKILERQQELSIQI